MWQWLVVTSTRCTTSLTKITHNWIARGTTANDPIGILFEAYLMVPCHNFKTYICCQLEDYLDGKLTTITHKALMTLAKRKFDWLKTKGLWGAKSPDVKTIVAMTAALNALKGQLKLDHKLSAIANEGKKKGNNKDKKTKKQEEYLHPTGTEEG
jgi:hypothetical protein